ncbi:MAG TPA: hypothetical protein VLG91_09700 [Streptomyces sp.]|nr:hypothetical protein [Streptomyces sp.]
MVDRLIAPADDDVDHRLPGRAGLSRAQRLGPASRSEENGVRPTYRGRPTAADVDPTAQPRAALALLLDEGAGAPERARLLAADQVVARVITNPDSTRPAAPPRDGPGPARLPGRRAGETPRRLPSGTPDPGRQGPAADPDPRWRKPRPPTRRSRPP